MSHHRRRSVNRPTLTFISHGVSSSDASTYDFGNFNAPAPGLMIVGVAGTAGAARSISSVSIGGTNGVNRVELPNGVDMWTPAAFFTRAVAPGNNNVTVTFSAAMQNAGVAVWLLTNYASAVPHATDDGLAPGAVTSQDVSLNIPVRGVAAFIGYHSSNEGTAWSSASERVDVTMESFRFVAADKTVVAAITPHTETVSWATGAGSFALGASWS